MKTIKLYDNFLSASVCKQIIDTFKTDKANQYKGVVSYKEHAAHENDLYLTSTDIRIGEVPEWNTFNIELHNSIGPYLVDYLKQFKHVNLERSFLHPDNAVLSVYPKGKGHFAPHKDIAVTDYTRDITILLYLNNVYKGGHTEFFNQGKKVKPKRGRLLFAPSGFDHGHQGHMPISNDKYLIVTFAEVQIEKTQVNSPK